MSVVEIAALVVCIGFILIAHLRIGSGNFYLGTERYGAIISAVSLVAAFTGGGALINTSSLATKYGTWAFFDVFSAVLGLLLSAVLISAGFFGRRFSRQFFDVNSTVYDQRALAIHYTQIAVLYILVMTAQFRAVATIALQMGISPVTAVIVIAVAVALYAYRGFDAVTRTDVAQVILMLPMYLIVLISAYDPSNPPSSHAAPPQQSMPWALALALSLPIFFLPISQEVHQRSAASTSDRDALWSCSIAALIYFVLGTTVVLSFASHPTLSLFSLVNSPNTAIAILVTVGLVAALMSTIDTATNIASHSLQKLHPFKEYPPQMMQVAALTLAALLFTFFPDVLSVILLALLLYMAGPAFTFVGIHADIHPRTCATIGSFFVGLQSVLYFKGAALFAYAPALFPGWLGNPAQTGIALLVTQGLVMAMAAAKRRFQ